MSSTAEKKIETKVDEEEEGGVAEADICCANCGAAEVDDIKLEECPDCDLVKYCGDKCREDHREQHEEECNKREAELHDKELFTQPDETHEGECPICFLPLPVDPQKSMFWSCCSETICIGCSYTNMISNLHDLVKARSCAFCREPASTGGEEIRKRLMKRIKANDPVAMYQMGKERYDEGDYDTSFEYFIKAAELGDIGAHFKLGFMYDTGAGVRVRDMGETFYHYEKAAIGGHPYARYNLAGIEEKHGNTVRSAKHLIIAANLGMEAAMKELWSYYSDGSITKEDLDATLRSHQAAVDAMKSEQRDAAEVWQRQVREMKGGCR
jgi:hypothetical protein